MLIRSHSASNTKRPSTAIVKSHQKIYNFDHVTPTTKRSTLNNLIPDMPSFSKKNGNSTALLYSKFIMKGIKTNKIDLVKQSFNMKIQSLAYEKKNSLNVMKNTKTSNDSQFLNSTIKKAFKKEETTQYGLTQLKQEGCNTLDLQINQFLRIKSAKKQNQNNQIDSQLLNVFSQRKLSRPKSAFTTTQNLTRNTRAKTAKPKQTIITPNPFTIEYDASKQCLTERKIQVLENYNLKGRLFVNHVERNKRLISGHSNKNSMYLTGIDIHNKIIQNQNQDPKKLLIQKLKKNTSPRKNKESLNEDQIESEYFKQRKKAQLTQKQIEEITHRNKVNAEFMKINMPHQYKKYVLYLQMRLQNLTQNDRTLLSIDLDNNKQQFGFQNKKRKNSEQNFQQVKQYYSKCNDLCDEALHHISLFKNRQKKPKISEQILDVQACQQILKLQHQRVQIKENIEEKPQQSLRLTQIKQKMFSLVKRLAFFKQKNQQISKKIFDLQFSLLTFKQDQTIIKQGDQIKFIYVILSGSAVKEQKKYQTMENSKSKIQNLSVIQFQNSLFDGQSFGQPQNKTVKCYNYEIMAAQRVLLMKLPFFQYTQIFQQSSDIKERIQLLCKIFGNVSGFKQLQTQNFQQLALEIEPLQFQAKQVILRKNDPCSKLIFIASGKVQLTNQHILKRQKKNSKDIKKKCKSLTKINLGDFSIEDLRRKNVKNYEILHENQEQFIFYYQDVAKQLIKGDVFNWQGFYHHQIKRSTDQSNFITNYTGTKHQVKTKDQFKLSYSLISKADNTKIFMLDWQKVYKIPQSLKHVIEAKVNIELSKLNQHKKNYKEENKFRSIQKWDQFKLKLCHQIVKNKNKL